MSSVTHRPRPVNPTGTVFDSARFAPRKFFGGPELFEPEPPPCPVRAVMKGMGYASCDIDATLSWLDHRGTSKGCPVIDQSDVFLIDCAYRDPAPRRPGMTLTPVPPGTFFPSPEDAAAAAAMFAGDPLDRRAGVALAA
ncbi:MAG: hypothetical protein K2X82_26900, partial [Gemmataceae bacterium]|nr:hypothetical protein [Gemmataceae bacterium]